MHDASRAGEDHAGMEPPCRSHLDEDDDERDDDDDRHELRCLACLAWSLSFGRRRRQRRHRKRKEKKKRKKELDLSHSPALHLSQFDGSLSLTHSFPIPFLRGEKGQNVCIDVEIANPNSLSLKRCKKKERKNQGCSDGLAVPNGF